MPTSVALTAADLAWGLGGLLPWAVWTLAVAGAVGVAVVAYTRTEPDLATGPRTLLSALRAAAFALLALLIAEPVLHREREVRRDPSVLVLVDDSASMAILEPDGRSRDAAAREVADRAVRALVERPGRHRTFAGEGARRLTVSSEIGREVRETGAPLAEGSDPASLLVSSVQRHLEDELAAVLLVSDGRSTLPRSPSLDALGVAVSVIAVGDSAGPSDLRLDRVRYPSFAHRGDAVQIEAELVVDGPPPGAATALLEREGAVVDSLRVSWISDSGRLALRFVVDADSVGLHRYRLRVRPTPGETIVRNNATEIGFEVGKRRLRVLHLARRPDWNAHFLARIARSDPRFGWVNVHEAEDGLRIAGTDSVFAWPPSSAVIEEVDVWSAGSFEDLARLAQAVPLRERVLAGAGLLVLAGDGRGDVRLPDGVSVWMPLQPDARAFWRGGECRAELTAQGRVSSLLALSASLGPVDGWIPRLPPLSAYVQPLRVAEDADLLIQGRAGRVLTPLLALRDEGQGKVALFAGASLWNWSFWRLGATTTEPVAREWVVNLLAHLAEGGARERLRLQLPGPVVAEGDEAVLRALVLDARLQPDDSSDVWLEWRAADADSGRVRRLRMQVERDSPGGRRSALPPLPAGEHQLRVTLEESSSVIASPWQSLTVDPYGVEFRDPAPDRAALARIARVTGGKVLEPSEVDAWVGGLELSTRTVRLSGRSDLWAAWWPLALLLGVLAGEWVLRKRWGLL